MKTTIALQFLKTDKSKVLLGFKKDVNNLELFFSVYGAWNPFVIFVLIMIFFVFWSNFSVSGSEFKKKSVWVFASGATFLGLATAIGESIT